jgi:UDP-2-acetamido-2-deoxy-ribo-hexuluronate aminotransferase
LLRVKLRHLPAWTARRQALATRYTAALAGIAGLMLPSTPPGVVHVFHQYTVRAPGRRDALRAHLEGRGIGSTVYYPIPAHLQPALAALGYRPGDLPLAERASGEVLSLPIFPELTDSEQDTVVSAIRDFFAVN